MKPFTTLFLLLLFSASVSAQEASAALQPPWLQLKIAEFQKLPPFSPPRSILRARYEGRTVYYVSPACCDIPSELYTESGSLLCYPDGGFAGGDGKCPSFTFVGNSLSTVWRDDRDNTARSGKKPTKKQ